ncbi:hypothetical protein SAMN07250955_11129 [Arboricoccus pini]|uniref:Uncharacterized protein n=1 Tax=Arboricoccus pini TaxID=1963835 RepID=A0A212RNC5_9PROT|nr:hypothetical protein SAMN07250955_11129 [Arboricoccus pini]
MAGINQVCRGTGGLDGVARDTERSVYFPFS